MFSFVFFHWILWGGQDERLVSVILIYIIYLLKGEISCSNNFCLPILWFICDNCKENLSFLNFFRWHFGPYCYHLFIFLPVYMCSDKRLSWIQNIECKRMCIQSTHRLPQSHVIYNVRLKWIEQVYAKTWDISKDNDHSIL